MFEQKLYQENQQRLKEIRQGKKLKHIRIKHPTFNQWCQKFIYQKTDFGICAKWITSQHWCKRTGYKKYKRTVMATGSSFLIDMFEKMWKQFRKEYPE